LTCRRSKRRRDVRKRIGGRDLADDQRDPERHEMSYHENDQNPRRVGRAIHRGIVKYSASPRLERIICRVPGSKGSPTRTLKNNSLMSNLSTARASRLAGRFETAVAYPLPTEKKPVAKDNSVSTNVENRSRHPNN